MNSANTNYPIGILLLLLSVFALYLSGLRLELDFRWKSRKLQITWAKPKLLILGKLFLFLENFVLADSLKMQRTNWLAEKTKNRSDPSCHRFYQAGDTLLVVYSRKTWIGVSVNCVIAALLILSGVANGT